MKIGCSLYSYRKTLGSHEFNLEDSTLWQEYQNQGIEGVELWVPPIEKLNWDEVEPMRKLQSTLADYNISILGFCVESGFMATSVLPHHVPYEEWLESAKRANMERGDYARFWLDIAGEVGVPNMRFCFGPGFYGYTVTASEVVPFNVERAVELYEPLCQEAQDVGVRIGYENHGFITSDLAFAEAVLDRVPNLNVCLDVGNLPENRWPYIEAIASRGRVLYVHAKTYAFDENGEDTWTDFGKAMGILQNAGFDGWYSVEWEGSGLTDSEGVNKTVALLNKWKY
ncbi:MAG TPA: sugar phosphate isomerase/epimerase family protein [Candidatus Lokiarchaeia archaeon]|nr:sugar phosphate isomerase/epimerase family protein [Candidatus Lokiarchaeia archaeon]